jgi:hypothetical protein
METSMLVAILRFMFSCVLSLVAANFIKRFMPQVSCLLFGGR